MGTRFGAICAIAGSAAVLALAPCPGAGADTAGPARAAPATAVTIAAVGDTMLGTTPELPPDPGSYLGAVRSLHAAGLAQTGLPGEITVVRARGIKVAFVAFAPYPYDANLLNLPAARLLSEQARRDAPVVVVYMHAGAEGSAADHVTGRDEHYLGEDRGNPEAFAHMAIDAGASLVIASGPHVLRGMQFYKGHLIAYSLGNFAAFHNFATGGDLDLSVILHVTLSASGRFESARSYPVRFTGTGEPVPGGDAIAFTARLSTTDFGRSAARILASGVIKAP